MGGILLHQYSIIALRIATALSGFGLVVFHCPSEFNEVLSGRIHFLIRNPSQEQFNH